VWEYWARLIRFDSKDNSSFVLTRALFANNAIYKPLLLNYRTQRVCGKKSAIYPNTMARAPQRCSCIGLRSDLLAIILKLAIAQFRSNELTFALLSWLLWMLCGVSRHRVSRGRIHSESWCSGGESMTAPCVNPFIHTSTPSRRLERPLVRDFKSSAWSDRE